MLLAAYILIVHVGVTHGVYTALKNSSVLDEEVPYWQDWLVTLVIWPYLLGTGLMAMFLSDEEEVGFDPISVEGEEDEQ